MSTNLYAEQHGIITLEEALRRAARTLETDANQARNIMIAALNACNTHADKTESKLGWNLLSLQLLRAKRIASNPSVSTKDALKEVSSRAARIHAVAEAKAKNLGFKYILTYGGIPKDDGRRGG